MWRRRSVHEFALDLILHRGLFTTLDRGNPTAGAVHEQTASSPPSVTTKR
jgi:hypothetical protein